MGWAQIRWALAIGKWNGTFPICASTFKKTKDTENGGAAAFSFFLSWIEFYTKSKFKKKITRRAVAIAPGYVSYPLAQNLNTLHCVMHLAGRSLVCKFQSTHFAPSSSRFHLPCVFYGSFPIKKNTQFSVWQVHQHIAIRKQQRGNSIKAVGIPMQGNSQFSGVMHLLCCTPLQ